MVCLCFAGGIIRAGPFDASAQFDKNNNPSLLGPWSYGYYGDSLGAGFTLFDNHANANIWSLLSDPDGLPQVAYNPNPSSVSDGPTTVDPFELNLHSGQIGGASKYSVLRFTTPVSGAYTISSLFSGNSGAGTSTDIHVLTNGISIFDSSVIGFGSQVPFIRGVNLAAGDKVDVAVGDNGNGFTSDSTGLFLTIGSTPGGTVASYHFNAGQPDGVGADSSPNQLNGSIIGTVGAAPGVHAEAIDLSGDFNYVSVPASLLLVLPNSWTVELFFKAKQPYTTYGSDPSFLIVKHHTTSSGSFLSSFGISLSADGRVYGETASAIGVGTFLDSGAGASYTDGQWHHVALVYNANAATGDKSFALYVDHVQRALAHGAFAPTAWANRPLYIGAGNFPGGDGTGPFRRNFDGLIDEVRISNVALDPSNFVPIRAGTFGLLAIEKVGDAVQVSWPSATNKAYQLQYRSDFTVGAWSNLGGPTSGTGSDLRVTDPLFPDRASRYYQVIQSP
jgi:hypothetical protein